jgi:hypothetical protein
MVPTIRSDILPHSAVGEMFLGGDIEVDETSFCGKRTDKRKIGLQYCQKAATKYIKSE